MDRVLDGVREWLPDRLAELARQHRVPGAAVAVLAGDEIAEAAYGVLSKATGVEATTDSVFQIGSVTKPWTASLVMQLVDEGSVDLDAPACRYLPDFRVADEWASTEITIRHLACHVAGFEGDIWTDTGRGDDAIEKYLAAITGAPQLFPPGKRFSYNNAGYVVLGRIIEVLRDKPYAAALRDHLIEPLGLAHAATDAYEAILHRTAVGHIKAGPDAEPQPAPSWALAASNAPAGALLAMSAADLVRFAKAHLDGGDVLSRAAVEAMRQRQVQLPDLGTASRAWGIGWTLYDWGGDPVVGHDGGVIGQEAYLRLVPGSGVAAALLTNGGDTLPVYREIVGRALRELAGACMPDPPMPPADPKPAEPRRYVGRYESEVVAHKVTADEDRRLWLSTTPRGVAVEAGMSPERYEIVRLRGETFLSAEPRNGTHASMTFLDEDAQGRARFLHLGSRARPRVAEPR